MINNNGYKIQILKLMYNKLKNVLAASWPFIGLALFFVWGYIYIKPMLPEEYFSLDTIKNVLKKEAVQIDPDEKYSFRYVHDDLKPKTREELQSAILSDSEESRAIQEKQVTTTVINVQELQSAIKEAKPNDTILLQAGIYKTKLFINKDLNIQGQGTSTILIGGDRGTAIYGENCKLNLSHLMIIDSDSAIKTNNASGDIRALTIRNNKKSGIELRNSKFTIKDNL